MFANHGSVDTICPVGYLSDFQAGPCSLHVEVSQRKPPGSQVSGPPSLSWKIQLQRAEKGGHLHKGGSSSAAWGRCEKPSRRRAAARRAARQGCPSHCGDSEPVLVCSGRHNNTPQNGRLQQRLLLTVPESGKFKIENWQNPLSWPSVSSSGRDRKRWGVFL